MEQIKQYIRQALAWLKQLYCRIVNGILNFARHIVGWFQSLNLNPKKEIPFIADKSLLKERIKNAPVKNVGIFKGVYNEELDEITHSEYLAADEIDNETIGVMGDETLVVLS